jgi:hypothetical protein
MSNDFDMSYRTAHKEAWSYYKIEEFEKSLSVMKNYLETGLYDDLHLMEAKSFMGLIYSSLNRLGFYPVITDTSKKRHNVPIRSVHDQAKTI